MNTPALPVTAQQVLRRPSGFVLVAGAALLFACKGTLVKFIYQQGASVADVMLLRMLFSLPVYGWVAATHLRREWQGIGLMRLLLAGLVGISGYYLASYLDLLGLQTISAGLERIILYTYPVFVILLSALLLGKRISLALCLCVAVIYGGLLLAFYADVRLLPQASWRETARGAGFVLLSAVSFALYVIGADHCMQRFSSALFTAVAMAAAAVVIVLHYAVFAEPAALLALSWQVYASCAVMALLFTVLPSFMMSAGVREIGSARAGAIGMVGPVATLLIAALVLGEPLGLLQLVGLAVVMFGVHRLQRT